MEKHIGMWPLGTALPCPVGVDLHVNYQVRRCLPLCRMMAGGQRQALGQQAPGNEDLASAYRLVLEAGHTQVSRHTYEAAHVYPTASRPGMSPTEKHTHAQDQSQQRLS